MGRSLSGKTAVGWLGTWLLLGACGDSGTSSPPATVTGGAGGAGGNGQAGISNTLAGNAGSTAGLPPTATAGSAGSGPDLTPSGSPYVHVGTYGQNIHTYALQTSDGSFTPVGDPIAAGDSPSFLAVDPTRRLLFAANETYGADGGHITSFRIDPASAKLTRVNNVATGAFGTVHVSVAPAGSFVVAANYGQGETSPHGVTVFAFAPTGPDAGTLQQTVASEAAVGVSPHMAAIAPAGTFALVAAKGSDVLTRFLFDPATGALSGKKEAKLPAGAGPRHFAFHPNGKFVYLLNEAAGTLRIFPVDAATKELGSPLTPDILTLAEGVNANQNKSAEVQIAPSGKFLYVTNRTDGDVPANQQTDELVGYAVDTTTGKLTFVERTKTGGSEPRHFSIDASERWIVVANQKSNNVRSFRIDPSTGKLSAAGSIDVGAPAYAGVTYLP